MIYVCSLSRLHQTVSDAGAGHVITLINEGTPVERPASVPADRHLFLGMNDIAEPMDGMTLPGQRHVERLIDYMTEWDQSEPVVIHCWAGISRSTAAAFVSVCALNPDADEHMVAQRLRHLSPSATPNPRIVELADGVLNRGGRMVSAVRGIGRGANAFEGTPFAFNLDGAAA